jgi:antitoxin component YwqK of YwqJK toxin-antitoxin module
MSRRTYGTSIPADAVEVIEEYHPGGTRKAVSYFVGGDKVGQRWWYEDGSLEFEEQMRGGEVHGHMYRFYESGQLMEVQPYCDGKMHGTGQQWSEDGRLLVAWQLARGTGLDLWCDSSTGTLAEEHRRPGEGQLGYTRQWNADERTVWQEYCYVLGLGYHGVWREWNTRGRLRRGFPRYYVNDRRVTKRQYLRACRTDPMLPRYRAEEDDPHRKLPPEYLAQRRGRPHRLLKG